MLNGSNWETADMTESHLNGKRLLDAMAEDYLERERPRRRVFPWPQVGVAAFLVAVAFIGARMMLWGIGG